MRARALALVFSLLPLAPLARPEQFGDVTFATPAGWRQMPQAGFMELTPVGASGPQRIAIFIYPGRVLNGAFEAGFTGFVQSRLHPGEQVLTETPPQPQSFHSAIPVLLKIVAVQDASRQKTLRFYMGFHVRSRLELLAIATPNEQIYKEYEPVLKEFLANLQFAGEPSPGETPAPTPTRTEPLSSPAPAPNGAGPLNGWYVTTYSSQQFNMMSHMYDYTIDRYYYDFLPDGRVCQNLPNGQAMDNFDYDLALRRNPAWCGSYSISGGKIHFKWGNGQVQHYAYQPAAAGPQIAGNVYLPIAPSDGLRLQGTFGTGNYVATAHVASEHSITFSADGRFSQRGFVGFAAGTGNIGAATSNRTSAEGTYQISGYSLDLNYSNGRHERASFFRYPGEENKALVINGVFYMRR